MSLPYKLKVEYLLSHELEHELAYRNVEVLPTVAERRKLLRGILAQEASGRCSILYENSQLNFDSEVNGIELTLSDLSKKISEFVGSDRDNEYLRLTCRLAHANNRVSRLSCNNDEEELKKKQFATQILLLEGELDGRLPGTIQAQSTPVGQNQSFTFSKPVPIYKWGIHFSGNAENESLAGFLERVECLKISRGVTDNELFSSAADLFTDQAFYWYLNNRSQFQNWSELVSKLKSDFLPYNYQEDLLDEIKNRKQNINEKVTLYINSMCSLFNRLEIKQDESSKIRIIKRNLLSNYVQPLALLDINSIEELTDKCKKLEESFTYSQNSQNSSISSSKPKIYLEPQLNNTFTSSYRSRNHNNSRHLSTVSTVSSHKVCWNCGEQNHFYPQCKYALKVFCYGCGNPGFIKSKCPNCSKNEPSGQVNALVTPTAPQNPSGSTHPKQKNSKKQTKSRTVSEITPSTSNQ